MKKIYLLLVLAHGMASHGAHVADLAVIRTKYEHMSGVPQDEKLLFMDTKLTLAQVDTILQKMLASAQIHDDILGYEYIQSGADNIQQRLANKIQLHTKLGDISTEAMQANLTKHYPMFQQPLQFPFYSQNNQNELSRYDRLTDYYYYNKPTIDDLKLQNIVKDVKISDLQQNHPVPLNVLPNATEGNTHQDPIVWMGLGVSLLCNIYLLYQDEDEDEEPKPSKTSKLAKRAKTSKLAKQTQRATPRPAKEKQAKP